MTAGGTDNMDKRIRLLIAEDNPYDVELLELAFKQRPVAYYHIARDGAEVLEYLEHTGPYADRNRYQDPNLLILDLVMPKIDGFELLQKLAEHPIHRFLTRIAVTSTPSVANVKRAYDLGAHSVFKKAESPQAIAEQLENIGKYWLRAEFYDAQHHQIVHL